MNPPKMVTIFLALLLQSGPYVKAQVSSRYYERPPYDRSEFFAMNAAFGFLTGSIGVLINDPEPTVVDVLIKGGLQGAVGSSVMFLGKSSMSRYAHTGRPVDFWSSKLIFEAGNSILVNASRNRWLYESVTWHYLYLRLNYEFKPKHLNIWINYTVATGDMVYMILNRRTFQPDLSRTLMYGVLVLNDGNSGYLDRDGAKGRIGIFGGIKINSKYDTREQIPPILAHELLHHFQNVQFALFTQWTEERIRILPKHLGNPRETNRIRIYSEWIPPVFHDFVAFPLARKLSNRYRYFSNVFEGEADFICNLNFN